MGVDASLLEGLSLQILVGRPELRGARFSHVCGRDRATDQASRLQVDGSGLIDGSVFDWVLGDVGCLDGCLVLK